MKINITQIVFGLSLCVIWTQQACSEEGAIAPDRPGLATGTHTVAPGFSYVEVGYQYAWNRSGQDNATHTLPQFVFRQGVTDTFEIDVIWNGWNQDHNELVSSETSFSDLSLGGKLRLLESESLNLTLMGLVSFPIGSSPSTSSSVDPYVGLLWDYSLSNDIQLFGVLQANRFKADDYYIDRQFVVGLAFSHTEQLSSFVEFFTTSPDDNDVAAEELINGGFTYLYSRDIQLDISVGAALNNETSHFVSLGIAARF